MNINNKQSQQLQEAVQFIKQNLKVEIPRIGIVLGSGLGPLADTAEDVQFLETKDIPNWPKSTVRGHRGRLVIGRLSDIPLVMQQGRVHYYEGHSIQQVVFPIRVMAKLGVETVIFTNAAGAFNPKFHPGDLMLITDHINFMGTNPLIGPNDPDLGTRFPDMSEPYNKALQQIALETAAVFDIPLKKGVLIASSGPSYETSAEVGMMRKIGGDAGCMSTVPEVIAGAHMGLRMMGISCITNMGTGLSDAPLTHQEVEETALKGREQFVILIREILKRIHKLAEPR